MKQFSHFSLNRLLSSLITVLGFVFLNSVQAENSLFIGSKGVTGLILSTTGPTGPTGYIEVKNSSRAIEIKNTPRKQTYTTPTKSENTSKKTDISPLKDLEKSKIRLKTPKKKTSRVRTSPAQINGKPSSSQSSEYHYEVQTELYEVEPPAKEHETGVESSRETEVESHEELPLDEEEHHEEASEPEEHHEEPAEEEHHEEEAEPEEHHVEPAEEEHHEEESESADDSSDSDE